MNELIDKWIEFKKNWDLSNCVTSGSWKTYINPTFTDFMEYLSKNRLDKLNNQ